MKVTVDSQSVEALAVLLDGREDPCVVIVHHQFPSRDLLRGPDGKAVHVRIEHPPWEAILLAQAAQFIEATPKLAQLECSHVRCMLLGEDVAGLPDLKIAVEGQQIRVEPAGPDAVDRKEA